MSAAREEILERLHIAYNLWGRRSRYATDRADPSDVDAVAEAEEDRDLARLLWDAHEMIRTTRAEVRP